jgi:hypothetical protein
MKNFSSRIIFLLLAFLLPSWVYAADGDNFSSLIELNDEDALMFAKAICENEQKCEYGVDKEPYGPFVKFSEGYLRFYEVIYGKFSQGEMPEAFVHVTEKNESEPYGRGLLFRYQNDRWNYITLGEPPLGHCGKLAGTANKESIICFFDFSTHISDPYTYSYSEGSAFYMTTFDFVGNTVKRNELIGFGNNSSVFCDERTKYLPTPYYEFLEFSQADIDNNSYADLGLKISETKFDTKHCYNRETGILQQSNNSVSHQLTWLFDGETFTPTPETLVFLEMLPKQ